MIRKLLVANRGEIALRVMRTAKEMGIATVAVYSEADRDAAHVAYADEAYLLGPPTPTLSYLSVERLLEVARKAAADAVHPGYGFLAENADFARAVIDAGLAWVGPHPDAIEAMGDKLSARRAVLDAGVPVVPGGSEPISSTDEAEAAAREYGLPLALKASGGGGGKGLKVAHALGDVVGAFNTARREAEAYFGNGTIYAERYLENPKHIELQVLADKHGTVLHVGERDCSLQRRHQKLLEETPPTIPYAVREALREAGIRAARAMRYDSVGTIETLVEGDRFYFLEMNTRIQVEHTVTEMVTGIDLIREQIRVAAGEPLGYTQDDVHFRGHAIEVRVNAEDPAKDFQPSPGSLAAYREPAGFGVRVDSAAGPGFTVTPQYDSLIAKLIVWDESRPTALARLRRAIEDYRIVGVSTTLPFLRALVDEPQVRDATYGTATLGRFAETYRSRPERQETTPSRTAGASPSAEAMRSARDDGAPETVRVEVNGRLFTVSLIDGAPSQVAANRHGSTVLPPPPRPVRMESATAARAASSGDVIAPMHGVVVEVNVTTGDAVENGQVVAVIEAMKMMNEIHAHRAGTVAAVLVQRGAAVEPNTTLLRLA